MRDNAWEEGGLWESRWCLWVWIGFLWMTLAPLMLPLCLQRYIFDDWESDTFTSKWKQCGLYAKGFLQQFADVPVMIICSWCEKQSHVSVGAM